MTHFLLSDLYHFLSQQHIADFSSPSASQTVIRGFSPLNRTRPNTLSWMKNQSLDWSAVQAGVIICAEDAKLPEDSSIVFIPVDRPRLVFAKVAAHFGRAQRAAGIESTARLGQGCVIGERVYIGHYTVLGDRVVVGDDTVIHSHVNIYHDVTIGRRCSIDSGTVIGADGFGFEQAEDGEWFKFPQLGAVVIADDVEVGANVCIDRGALSDTIIQANAKIDNLCHIAHNVEIGAHSLVIAHAQIAGSVKVGEHAWIAPGAMIKNGLSVGDHALVGLGAVVVKDVPAHDVVAARPAMSIKPKE